MPTDQAVSAEGSRPASPAAAPAPNAAASYLRAKILTATPEQLQLMLYDGAIRFAEQGKAALAERRFDASYNALTRAQNILTELTCSLKHEAAPDLCRNLAALYTFAFMRLVDANVTHNAQCVEEALSVLRYQRETWVLLMQTTARQKAGDVARSLDLAPSADAERVERLSVQG